jgi:hypothetical protein
VVIVVTRQPFHEREPGATAMLALLAVTILCVFAHVIGYLGGMAHGYAQHVCRDHGLEYVSHMDREGHRFATCIDRQGTPIIQQVW